MTVLFTDKFSNSLFFCKIVNMIVMTVVGWIMCWFLNIAIGCLQYLSKYVDCFLILWLLDEFHMKEKGQAVMQQYRKHTQHTFFFFISESAHWSSTTDAYSHSATLTIHPLQSARIRAGLLRTTCDKWRERINSSHRRDVNFTQNSQWSNKKLWATSELHYTMSL